MVIQNKKEEDFLFFINFIYFSFQKWIQTSLILYPIKNTIQLLISLV